MCLTLIEAPYLALMPIVHGVSHIIILGVRNIGLWSFSWSDDIWLSRWRLYLINIFPAVTGFIQARQRNFKVCTSSWVYVYMLNRLHLEHTFSVVRSLIKCHCRPRIMRVGSDHADSDWWTSPCRVRRWRYLFLPSQDNRLAFDNVLANGWANFVIGHHVVWNDGKSDSLECTMEFMNGELSKSPLSVVCGGEAKLFSRIRVQGLTKPSNMSLHSSARYVHRVIYHPIISHHSVSNWIIRIWFINDRHSVIRSGDTFRRTVLNKTPLCRNPAR